MSHKLMILTFLTVAVCLFPDHGQVQAAPFQIIIAETPMVSGGGQGIRRYIAYDTFGAILQLTPIPGSLVNDPSGLALRNDTELFVGNRAAHTGNGSISRFTLNGSFYQAAGTITGNYVTDCHQLAFDYANGELFQTNWQTGKLSRFLFDQDGNAVANGFVQMPDTDDMLGVAVRPADRQLFVSDYDYVRRFSRDPDGSYTFISTFGLQSGELYHLMKFHSDELYLAAFQTNRVLRYSFDTSGNPVFKQAIVATGAVDMDFSPDGQEMFVTNHRNGGITRYRYDTDTDTWAPFGDVIPTPSLGGIVITPTVCPLQADLTGDCVVNMHDLYAFVGQWLQSVDPYYCTLSGNMAGPEEECSVNMKDFSVFASQWMMEFGGE
jgi:DNA-binding beta-propeller fold protein YncE